MAKGLGCSSAAPLESGTPAPGSRRLTTSLLATKIRRPVFGPCLAISMAATTPLPAFIRSLATRAAFLAVPLELIRSRTTLAGSQNTANGYCALHYNTQGDHTTRPLVFMRSLQKHLPAISTRPTVIKRSSQHHRQTRPTVMERSISPQHHRPRQHGLGLSEPAAQSMFLQTAMAITLLLLYG